MQPDTTLHRWIADDEYTVNPKERVWARRSFEVFSEQAQSTAGAGVRTMQGYRLLQSTPDKELPWFAEFIPSLRALTQDEVQGWHDKHSGVVAGWTMEDVLINPERYLSWLREQLFEKGGVLMRRDFKGISSVWSEFGDSLAVVNCSRLGASQLIGDEKMYPVRGQTVLVDAPGIDYWLSIAAKKSGAEQGEASRLDGKKTVTYIFPVGDGNVLLGGTKRRSRMEIEDLEYTPDDKVTAEIIQGCAVVEPAVLAAAVVRAQVGYRPFREGGEIRVELEKGCGGQVLVHNYGHSDYGMGVCWGCAFEVVELLQQKHLA